MTSQYLYTNSLIRIKRFNKHIKSLLNSYKDNEKKPCNTNDKLSLIMTVKSGTVKLL